MMLAYSFLLTLAFIIMSPLFLLRRQKYAAGFRQRLGNYPQFISDDHRVIWLHCVSVGETNAARPLVDELRSNFPDHRLVISTTTLTGQILAQNIFKDKADAIFYFPFDWKFSVRKALANYKPSLVLLMETEIWPRLIHEAKKSAAKIAVVNGRLSEKSFQRYKKVGRFVKNVLANVDLALMQDESDAERIRSLRIDPKKIRVTGNLKFEIDLNESESKLTSHLRERFDFSGSKPLIVAASTHDPEEKWVLEALDGINGFTSRLLIAPRHPERFDQVAKLLDKSAYRYVRRSAEPSERDKEADVILLDTIGELRAVYPLAEIVFVGGSLIPHGGQSILEPARAGKAIVTGPYTMNFAVAIKEFLEGDAILQTSEVPQEFQPSERLYEMFTLLLENESRRQELGQNAAAMMGKTSRGASVRTVSAIRSLLG